MTIAVIAVSIVALAAIGALGWQIYRADSRGDQLVKEREAHAATTLERDRLRFELQNAKDELAIAEQTADELAKESEVEEPNSDLDKRDVATRVRRAAEQARAAEARRTSLVFAKDEDVPTSAAATDAKPAEVRATGSLDPDEVLR